MKGFKGKTLICVLLLVPIVFIAYLAVVYSSRGISSDDVRSVTLKMPSGDEIVLDNADDISFYVNAVLDSAEISAPLRDTGGETAVLIQCDRGDRVLEYKLWPELSLTGCMLGESDGKLHVLDNDTARALLSRPEYSYLYAARFTQPISVMSGEHTENVMPSSYEWNYRLVSGEYAAYTDSPVYDGVTVYSLYSDRDNSLGFDVPPQNVTVELTGSDGEVLPETDVGKLIFAHDTAVDVKVTAEWTHTGDCLFYGKAIYRFKALYDIPSTLELSADTVTAGSYIFVNVKHLNDAETVSVSAPITVSPVAFSENSGIRTAALGISSETQPGTYDLTFTIGANTYTKSITVTSAGEPAFHRLSISTVLYDRLLGDPAVKELNDLILGFNGEVSAAAYSDPSAKFGLPADNAELETSFGTQVLMNLDGGTDSHACTAIGDTYKCVSGARVYAAKAGKVVYSGVTLTMGELIVIDHGCGLQTWYYGLKSAERTVGTEVSEGEVIGFAGSSDYVGEPRVCFAVSVCGMFVSH